MRLTLLLVLSLFVSSPVIESRASDDSDEGQVILAVFAHADDESMVAPLLARYAREGARVHLAIATDGRFGVTEHAGIPAGDQLAQIREEEARCAAEKLGIRPPRFLGFPDGFSHRSESVDQLLGTQAALHAAVRSLFDELRPDVVITWGPEGGYGHPDHRMVSDIVSEVFQEGASAWPQQLLFPGIPTARLRDRPADISSLLAQWFADNWHPVDDAFLDVRISFTDADARSARGALDCHASQFAPEDIEPLASLTDHLLDGAVTLRRWRRSGAGPAATERQTVRD